MAIKVIKHGETKFRITCPTCGCEFEYEFEDLVHQYDILKQVKCPDCGQWINHKDYTVKPYNPYPGYPYPSQPTWPKIGDPIPCSPYVTWGFDTANGSNLDCDKCPNKPDPLHPVVGDTPCTWCKKNQPYCYTGDINVTGGEYKVDPDIYKNVTYTNVADLNLEANNSITSNYTTDMGTIKK